MEFNVGTIELLLLIVAIVAMAARRFRIPYSVALVVAGISMSLFTAAPQVQLSRELVFTCLLSPLIFEAALYIRWEELRRDLPVILALASAGVVLSACITSLGLHYLLHWEWIGALLFSALIAATDPVSVIATFKEIKAKGRLRLLIEAESLFNDGTAAVAFTAIVSYFAKGSMSPFEGGKSLVAIVGGGLICGTVAAGAVLLLAGRTEDHLVEITLSTVGAYGSFLLAEHFGFSGVVATLTAGLILGNLGPLGFLTQKGREAVEAFWEYSAFVANSFVFC